MIEAREGINGMAIKLHRAATGKSQLALGEEVRRSQMWISRAERGAKGVLVTEMDVANLAKALGVRPDDLVAQ